MGGSSDPRLPKAVSLEDMATTPAVGFLGVALLMLLFVALGAIAATAGVWKLIKVVSARALPRERPRESIASSPAATPAAATQEDLQRYPERLEGLQLQLEGALRAGESQLLHLTAKRNEIAAKPGREALAERYTQDLALLEAQAKATQGVLATIWKTRAVLALRVHLAEAARGHPELDHLPQPIDVSPGQLDGAARAYARACRDLRAYLQQVDKQRARIHEIVPTPSVHAALRPDHRADVEREAESVEKAFTDLRERLDALADNLDYLSDRFHTQKVVEGSSAGLDLGPEGSALLHEVNRAILELDHLSAIGEEGLADVAVDGLAAEIANLEKVGLDIDLQADADREVERLLASFTRQGQPS